MAELRILDSNGDTKIIWDSTKEDEVETARQAFNRLKSKGYAAFRVKAAGGKGEQIQEFDPDTEKLIMVAPIAGGASGL